MDNNQWFDWLASLHPNLRLAAWAHPPTLFCASAVFAAEVVPLHVHGLVSRRVAIDEALHNGATTAYPKMLSPP